MTDKRKPGSFLLPLIAKIRAEPHIYNFTIIGPWPKV